MGAGLRFLAPPPHPTYCIHGPDGAARLDPTDRAECCSCLRGRAAARALPCKVAAGRADALKAVHKEGRCGCTALAATQQGIAGNARSAVRTLPPMRLRRHKPPPMRSKARPRPTAPRPRRHRARNDRSGQDSSNRGAWSDDDCWPMLASARDAVGGPPVIVITGPFRVVAPHCASGLRTSRRHGRSDLYQTALGSWTNVFVSLSVPATPASCCGPTMSWAPPGASIRAPDSSSTAGNLTTASGMTSSASTGRANCDTGSGTDVEAGPVDDAWHLDSGQPPMRSAVMQASANSVPARLDVLSRTVSHLQIAKADGRWPPRKPGRATSSTNSGRGA